MNDTAGFVCHSGGMSRTNDGGKTWVPLSDFSHSMSSVQFIGNDTGWAVGEDGPYYTTHKGINKSWSSKYVGFNLDPLIDLHYFDKKHIYLLSASSLVYTPDGGSSWIGTTLSLGYPTFSGVRFITKDSGWVTANNGSILLTTNGGFTFNAYSSGTNTNILSLSSSANTLYATGEFGMILKLDKSSVIFSTGIAPTDNYAMNQNVKLFPNPASGEVHVSIDNFPTGSIATLKLYDISGRLRLTKEKIQSPSFIINDLPAEKGMYIYEISSYNKSFLIRGKILIN